jgi:hypothetical protein
MEEIYSMDKNVVLVTNDNPVSVSSKDSEMNEQETDENSSTLGLLENTFFTRETCKVNILESIPIVLSESRLLNNFHDGEIHQISKRTKRQVHKAVKETLSIIKPRGIYRILPFKRVRNFKRTQDAAFFSSRYLSRILMDCEYVVVFLVTIGKEIDIRIKKRLDRNSSYGYILNYVAAAAAEETAQVLQRHIRESLPEGKTVTYRYSPGYCDWPLEEQSILFQTIPHNSIGVSLSEKNLMSPTKTVSGVFGICSSELGIKAINHCTKCSKSECPHRRK